jgi:hypothetical protein
MTSAASFRSIARSDDRLSRMWFSGTAESNSRGEVRFHAARTCCRWTILDLEMFQAGGYASDLV